MAQRSRNVGRRLAGRVGRTRLLVILAMVGPGFIAANAGNDAGGITTWSVIGSRYGYSMIWLLVVMTPVLAIVQEMNARVGVVTGRGLAGLIRENFSLKVTALAILATVIANFGTTVAEFSGRRRRERPAPRAVVRGRARRRPGHLAAHHARLIPQGGAGASRPGLRPPDLRDLGHPRRARLARGAAGATSPYVEWKSLWIFTVIAAVGTTLTPWGQFFIQAAVVDKKVPWRQFAYTKYEIYAGSVFMTTIDFFIVVACAATLYQDGIVVQSAEEAAMALVPFLGAAAQYLFAIGLLSVSILAAGVLPLATAYVVCEAFGFESGLDNSFREAPVFNGLITFLMIVPAAVAIIPGLPLVKVILVAQSLNGVLLPVILIFTLLMINNPRVMGTHVNGRIRNVIAWGFTVALIVMSAALLLSPLFT